MTEKYDLHCHSTLSDGTLSPTELVKRAQAQGVTALSLTDHDTTAGYEEAQAAAKATDINLISGIELSASWQEKTFHVVGLGIDPTYPPLQDATRHLQTVRLQRAEKIADKLGEEIYGLVGATPPSDQFQAIGAAFTHLPTALRNRFAHAILEIDQQVTQRKLDPESDEAKRLAVKTFDKWGFRITG